MPGPLNWSNATDKRRCDGVIQDKLKRHFARRKALSITSLSADAWVWESSLSELMNTKKLNFISVEQDPLVFEKMRQQKYRLNRKYNNNFTCTEKACKMSRFLRETDQTFDVIYADIFGPLSAETKAIVRTINDKKLLNKNGTFILTTSYARGCNAERKYISANFNKGEAVSNVQMVETFIPMYVVNNLKENYPNVKQSLFDDYKGGLTNRTISMRVSIYTI